MEYNGPIDKYSHIIYQCYRLSALKSVTAYQG